MRVCSWNMKQASRNSRAWDLLTEVSPDLALLQEVNSLPKALADQYDVSLHPAAGTKWGISQRFKTAILARGAIGAPIALTSRWEWVNRELDHFRGNLLAHEVTLLGQTYRVMSVYSPAWPVAPDRLVGLDVQPIKLKQNPKLWVTELLWAGLLDVCGEGRGDPWIVGGDLNASETFDMGPRGPRGNREVLDRMQALGLHECLRDSNAAVVPTFRTPRGGKIEHQMDHLFVSASMVPRLTSCRTGDPERVFKGRLSDHLPIVAEFTDPISR